jgi:NADPH:quinone reductase-like Zn-dependent oxidoreductase
MRALVLEAPNQAPVYGQRPLPEPGPGEARIQLHAAALNRRDVWIHRGLYPGIHHPIIVGSDGCGIVDAVGSPGDAHWLQRPVIANPAINWGDDPRVQGPDFEILGLPRDGTLAEAVIVPTASLHPQPAHLSATQAAALPLAGLTAWRALVTRGGQRPGDRVLITGIGGGVSQLALTFALARGATVVVTSSQPQKLQAAQSAGATGGVNYTEPQWRQAAAALIPGGLFDIIIDSAGGPGLSDLARLLAPGGRLVFYGGTQGKWPALLPQHLFYKQASLLGTTMGSPQDWAAMLSCVQTQRLVPTVDRIFPLAQGADAFTHLESGAQLGKVVLKIR